MTRTSKSVCLRLSDARLVQGGRPKRSRDEIPKALAFGEKCPCTAFVLFQLLVGNLRNRPKASRVARS